MINVAAINRYISEHAMPGATIPVTNAGGDKWPDDATTIKPWLEGHDDVYIDEWDDGTSHDRSTIKRLAVDTPQGEIIIWSYNNNAWGFADAYLGAEAPETVEAFCLDYANSAGMDQVEIWVLYMAGIDIDNED